MNKNSIGCLAKHLALTFLNIILYYTERSNEKKKIRGLGLDLMYLAWSHDLSLHNYIKHLIFDNCVATEMLNSNIQGYKQLNCFQHTRQNIKNDCVHTYGEILC